ncbi:transposase [Streptomyces sp. NBRC 110611]|uniref:IS3 family transposase n=1 Tax=Streptomyces sp. NBRC 110611 TaxID=1621259 RepID=UPI0008552475|nr:transposase [Streptomyces sp. NBRC 110611]
MTRSATISGPSRSAGNWRSPRPPYYATNKRKEEPSQRALRDEELKKEITRVHEENYGAYGARKIWHHLQREGIEAARCTVEHLMRVLGRAGAVRSEKRHATVPDPATKRPKDLV